MIWKLPNQKKKNQTATLHEVVNTELKYKIAKRNRKITENANFLFLLRDGMPLNNVSAWRGLLNFKIHNLRLTS